MRQRAIQGVLLATSIVLALGVLTSLLGVLHLSAPLTLSGVILAVGCGYWSWRWQSAQAGHWLPDPWRAALVVCIAALAGFVVAWHERRPEEAKSFVFVVNPHDYSVLESVAPTANTETTTAPAHAYGEHLRVICQTTDASKKHWYELADGNFLPAKELVPPPSVTRMTLRTANKAEHRRATPEGETAHDDATKPASADGGRRSHRRDRNCLR